MDIFKFTSTTDTNGTAINYIDSVTWIERYRKAGEFTIQGKVSSDLRGQLPLGSLISHLNTREVMIVENHEVSEEFGKEATVTITGRSFEVFLENRMAVANNFGANNPVTDVPFVYDLNSSTSWAQAVELIRNHSVAAYQLLNTMDNVANLNVRSENVFSSDSTSLPRVVKRGSVYERVLEMLQFSDLGIKTIRPTTSTFDLVVHGGVFLFNNVNFTWRTGDVKAADYLWSDKKRKNGALVLGKYTSKVIRPTGLTGTDVRMTIVDATDFEVKYTEDGTNFAYIDNVLRARGEDALRAQNGINIINAEVDTQTYKYRTDYNIGDRLWVYGNYGTQSHMRVTEYVEISDSSGYTGYPTLEVLTY